MLKGLFAPWVQALNLEAVSIEPGVAIFRLPYSSALCREGGSICGQALMSAADTAMVRAIHDYVRDGLASHAGYSLTVLLK
jgi:acyl-coenzyme A thioesterase PaaI-like protein